MAREPQLAQINQKLIDGIIDTHSYFREIGPFLGLTVVILDDEIYMFSDPVTYEVFKASDQWQKDLSKRGMPFVLTGQTGLQVVALLSKLAASDDNPIPDEVKFSVDVTHTTGIHISRLKTDVFVTLQRCLELEKVLLSEKSPNPDLTQAMANHDHLHVPTILNNGVETIVYFKLTNGQQVLPIFSAPDLAFGAMGTSQLGLFDVSGSELFRLLEKNPQIKTETSGILFNPYSNTEKLVQWQALSPLQPNLGDYGQSA